MLFICDSEPRPMAGDAPGTLAVAPSGTGADATGAGSAASAAIVHTHAHEHTNAVSARQHAACVCVCVCVCVCLCVRVRVCESGLQYGSRTRERGQVQHDGGYQARAPVELHGPPVARVLAQHRHNVAQTDGQLVAGTALILEHDAVPAARRRGSSGRGLGVDRRDLRWRGGRLHRQRRVRRRRHVRRRHRSHRHRRRGGICVCALALGTLGRRRACVRTTLRVRTLHDLDKVVGEDAAAAGGQVLAEPPPSVARVARPQALADHQ
jgi:hypothetical protein